MLKNRLQKAQIQLKFLQFRQTMSKAATLIHINTIYYHEEAGDIKFVYVDVETWWESRVKEGWF